MMLAMSHRGGPGLARAAPRWGMWGRGDACDAGCCPEQGVADAGRGEPARCEGSGGPGRLS